MPTKRDKEAMAEAKRLAKTGRYLNWWAIEKELEGTYPELRLLLGDERVREDLNGICAAAIEAKDA